MADDYENMRLGSDLLEKGSSRVASDRAKRISGLHRSVDRLVQEQNKKRLQVSNEVSALTKEQQKLMQQLEFERNKITNDTAAAYSGVIKGLGNTIKQLSLGVKNITVDTSKASSQAISQYGKAISEDISINKTNTIAMALSRATPLFGYFAAKFVETDVFQDAATRIREKIGGAVSAGLSKAGQSVAGIFKKGKEVEQHSMREDFGSVSSELSELKKHIQKKPPKLQEGGYVKRGGLVQVHSAEVITPIDKLLAQLDESRSADVAKRLTSNLQLMAQSLDRLEEVVVERTETKKTLIHTFINEFQKARDPRTEAWQTRLLKAILELKVATIGTTSQLKIAWQRTLLQHPSFRAMLMFGQTMQNVLTAPWKMLFGARGGYLSDVRRATRTNNIYMKMVNLLSILYTKAMPKLDAISLYTKASAEAAVGREIKPGTALTYTWFDKIREKMTSRDIGGSLKSKSFDAFVDNLGLDRRSLKEAGITSFGDLFRPGLLLKKMGVSKENIKEQSPVSDFLGGVGKVKQKIKDADKKKLFVQGVIFALTGGWSTGLGLVGKGGKFDKEAWARKKGQARAFGGKVKAKAGSAVASLRKLVKFKRDQEEREGPHSPSMAENIASTAKTTWKGFKERVKTEKEKLNLLDRIKKKTAESADHLGGISGKLKKWGKKLFGWIPIVFQAIMSFLGKGLGKASLGMHAAGSALGTGVSVGAGKLGSLAKKLKLGKVAGKVGRFGLRAGGLFAGAGMAGWDAASAMINPEGFVKSRMISGLAAFLGGKDTGLAGAKHGVMKGGLIGLGIGGPLGAAIGAIAGGILGFIGGKDLSKVLQTELKAVGEIVGAIWKIIKYPFDVIQEGFKSVWVLTKYMYKRLDAWLSGPGFIGSIWGMIKGFFTWIYDKIAYAVEWWKKLINVETIKKTLMAFMHPISGLVMLVKFIGSWMDNTIKRIPIIGRLYELSKKTVQSISGGTLASNLEAELNKTIPKPIPVPVRPPKVDEYTQKTADLRAALAARYANQKSSEYKAEKKLSEKQTKELVKKMEESGQLQSKTMVATSNSIISSSSANTSNISSGGTAGGGRGFGAGSKAAESVTYCDG
jgi:hypothetical protein